MQEALGDHPEFVLIGIGGPYNGDSAAKQKRMADSSGWHWTKLYDADGMVFDDYGVRAFPTLVLINPAGDVVSGSSMRQIKATLADELGVDLGATGGHNHGGGDGDEDSGVVTFRYFLIGIIVIGFVIVVGTRSKPTA